MLESQLYIVKRERKLCNCLCVALFGGARDPNGTAFFVSLRSTTTTTTAKETTQQWMTVRPQHQPRRRRRFLHSIFSAATTRLTTRASGHRASALAFSVDFGDSSAVSFSLFAGGQLKADVCSNFTHAHVSILTSYIVLLPIYPHYLLLSKPTRQ